MLTACRKVQSQNISFPKNNTMIVNELLTKKNVLGQ